LPHRALNGTSADSPATGQRIIVQWATTPVETMLALGIELPGHDTATLPAAEAGITQQILELAIAFAHLRIVLHVSLRCSKRVRVYERWSRNGDPFLSSTTVVDRILS
jgi:hypothetical protein